jgi:putative aldouronate transport system permease protein
MTPIIHRGAPSRAIQYLKQNYDLYLLLLPTVIYFFIFHYIPIYGLQMAFRDFLPTKGFAGSPWIGLAHFKRFFNSYYFPLLVRNTIVLTFYQLAVSFPFPIVLALLLNQLPSRRYRRIIQTVTYAPHFISTVVIVGMLLIFLSPRNGIVNIAIKALGGTPIFFIAKPGWFRTIYVFSGVWQNAGWASIIYLAALAGINPELHEAAIVDGANKIQRIRHIDIPGIVPTMIILLILRVGRIMSIGFEKAYLMQNSLNSVTSEIIATYVYKVGLLGAQYSFSAAVGFFNSIINFLLLVIVNKISKKVSAISLW